MNRIGIVANFTFVASRRRIESVPDKRRSTSRRQVSNLPHAPKVWVLPLPALRSTFPPPLPAPRLPVVFFFFLPSWTRSEILKGKQSDHFRADSPVQHYFSPPQVTCSPAHRASFFLRAFSSRGRRNLDRTGISTPCAVRLGSTERRNVDGKPGAK